MPVTLDYISATKALLDGQAHIYICDPVRLTDESELEEMRKVLSSGELDRLHAFKFEKDRHNFLVSHAMLRNALSNYSDVLPGDWSFDINEHEKPSVSGGSSQLAFNLTHADGLCAVVITAGSDCGIDIENVQRQNNIEGIAEKMFTAEEVAYMNADEVLKRERFFNLWTLRESFVKAVGTGLSGSSGDFHFVIDEVSGEAGIVFTGSIDGCDVGWSFRLSQPTRDHVMSVCVDAGSCNEIVVIDAIGI